MKSETPTADAKAGGMSDVAPESLAELYEETILSHSRSPCNYGRPAEFSHSARGYNPLCGDSVDVYLLLRDSVLAAVAFEASACAICVASASMMARRLQGGTAEQARALYAAMLDVTGQGRPQGDGPAPSQADGETMDGARSQEESDERRSARSRGDRDGPRVVQLQDAGAGEVAVDPGELVAFKGVRRYPLRAACATLPWATVIDALSPK